MCVTARGPPAASRLFADYGGNVKTVRVWHCGPSTPSARRDIDFAPAVAAARLVGSAAADDVAGA